MGIVEEVLRDSAALKRKKSIVGQMMAERTQFEGVWKKLSQYINPARGRFDEDKTANGGTTCSWIRTRLKRVRNARRGFTPG